MASHDRHPCESGSPEQPTRHQRLWIAVFAGMTLLMLAGCHGGTLDAVYPASLGHEPPPAVNLPPQDAGMEYR